MTTARPIETERLLLRALRESDLAAMTDLADDLQVSRWLGRMPHPYTPADAREFYVRGGRGETSWAIARRNDDAFMGVIGHGPRPGLNRIQIGYWLGRPYWGLGYGTEAARAVRDDAFTARPIHTLWVAHHLDNMASARIIEKLGFKPFGEEMEENRALGRRVKVRLHNLPRADWERLIAADPIPTGGTDRRAAACGGWRRRGSSCGPFAPGMP